jgi:hypothetical protein
MMPEWPGMGRFIDDLVELSRVTRTNMRRERIEQKVNSKKEQFFILLFKEPMYSKFQMWLKDYVHRTPLQMLRAWVRGKCLKWSVKF